MRFYVRFDVWKERDLDEFRRNEFGEIDYDIDISDIDRWHYVGRSLRTVEAESEKEAIEKCWEMQENDESLGSFCFTDDRGDSLDIFPKEVRDRWLGR